MTAQNKKENRELSLGDDFGPAVVTINRITLTIDAEGKPTLKAAGDATIITNGNITAYSTNGNVTAHTNGTVQIKAPAPEQTNTIASKVMKQAYNIGDALPDGWIYLGTSPYTGDDYSLEPIDSVIGVATWHKGRKHADTSRKAGNKSARQPTDIELNDIFEKIVKGGKNHNALLSTGDGARDRWYWSSTLDPHGGTDARVQCFTTGLQGTSYKREVASVRIVRSELSPQP